VLGAVGNPALAFLSGLFLSCLPGCMQSSIWRLDGMGFPKLRVHEISPGQSYCARFYDAGFGYGSTALDDSLGNWMPFLVEEGAWGGVLICRQIRGIEREAVECTG